MKKETNTATPSEDASHRVWHLARNELEEDVAGLEYALMRGFEAFGRWQGECLASVMDISASGPENAMLHIIRMHDRPKTIKELARLTNRDDIPNMQYSLRKLVAAGLVSRHGSGRSGVTYTVTEQGRQVTDRYADVRATLFITAIQSIPELRNRLKDAAATIDLLTGIYEQAARHAATQRHFNQSS